MDSSIKKNLGLQTLYQILNTCLPLITAPYLARVLGAEKLGIFSYTSSVVAYFALVAMIGTINYGTKSIAATGNNRKERSYVFCSIYSVQLVFALMSTIFYIVYVLFFCKANVSIAWIQILTLVSCFFDVTWLFFGTERFSLTVSVNMVMRVLTVASILLFVKTPDDLCKYTFIMLFSTMFNQIILWRYICKDIDLCRISVSDAVKHIKPNLALFIPLLAMSVYHIMDKTMLGLLSSYEQTGYYYNADKVINIPFGILYGVGTVMLPRMTSLINEGKRKKADDLFAVSMEGVGFVGVAMACGIAAISREFVPIFFGEGYEACISLTIVLAPVIVIKGISNTTRTQYLIPYEREIVFTKSVFVGAIVNLIINFLLIPRYGAMGAAIGTLVAELVACIWQLLCIRKNICLKQCLKNIFIYFLFGMFMFAIVRTVALLPVNLYIKTLVEIATGGVLFIMISMVYWKITNNEMFSNMFGSIIGKIPVVRKLL